MAKPIHMMIRAIDERKSVDFYRKALGLEIAARFPFDDFTLIYMRGSGSDFELELTINHGRTEAYTHGTGYGHLAVAVDNVDAEHQRLETLGLSPGPVKEFHRDGGLMAKFFFLQDPDGYKIEVLQRHGRYQ